MNELRPVPTDPAEVKVGVAGLSRDELMAVAQQVGGGGLTGRLGALGSWIHAAVTWISHLLWTSRAC